MPALLDFQSSVVVAACLLMWFGHAFVVGVAALLASRLLSSPASRATVLRCALLLPFVTTTAVMLSRGRGDATVSVAPLFRRGGSPVDVNKSQRMVNGQLSTVTTVRDDAGERDAKAVALIFFIAAVVGSALLVRRVIHSQQLLADRQLLDGAENLLVLPEFARLPRQFKQIRYSNSSRVQSAVALMHNEICLPADFGKAPEAELRAVLLHELAHLQRRDPLWSFAVDCVVAVGWLHPMLHVVRGEMRRCLELAADRMATERGASPVALIAALHRFASLVEMGKATTVGVHFARRRSLTVQRAVAIASGPPGPGAGTRWLVVWCGVIGMLVIGAVVAVPTLTVATPIGGGERSASDREVVVVEADGGVKVRR